jgi:mannan endo-1,4-beta-mannosidase
MKLAASIITLAISVSQVAAVVPVYGQCGGNDWTGETGQVLVLASWHVHRQAAAACASGSSCVFQNEWYSQCLPGGPTTSAPPPTTTTSGTTTSSGPTTSVPPPATTGFVKTSGTKFTLNGQTYTVAGCVL